jgi:hypothetical protein
MMMTKKLYSTFAMLSLFLMLAVVSVQAQSGGKLEVTVPFDFQIGDQTLPAGEYSIKRLTQNSMLVESADGQRSVIAQTPGAVEKSGKAARERVVFRQYGDQYFLAQVWMVRDGAGRGLIKSDAERQAARAQSLASGSAKPRQIEIAATSAR